MVQKDVAILANDLQHMQESFDDYKIAMKSSLEELKGIMKTHILQEEQMFERFEAKFAAKWTEKVMIFLATTI